MKAIVVEQPGSEWQVREVDKPPVGTREVLIKVHASGLCYTDIHASQGHFPADFPLTPGHEPAGEIVEVGVGVTGYRVGDRVGAVGLQETCGRCEWCQAGKNLFCKEQQALGITVSGAHAEYLVAHESSVVLLPDSLSYDQAAPILCAGYTVWSGLNWAEPKPSDTVAVLGIGGLGHLAVQYAKACGHRTIAITHSKDKEQLVRSLGADEVVANGDGLQTIGGADIILATGNSTTAMEDALQGIRPDGRLVVMGVGEKPLSIPLDLLVQRRIRIVGSQHNGKAYLKEALQMAAEGKVRVHTEMFKLDDAAKAQYHIQDGNPRFRAVFEPG
jgi:alcohol dehydrogenase